MNLQPGWADGKKAACTNTRMMLAFKIHRKHFFKNSSNTVPKKSYFL